MKTICIDAGHGGKDPGACAGGVCEKDIALNVAKKIGAFLEARGCTVMLTRETDVFVELSDRARMANSAKAGLYVSIHCNSVEGNARATGMEVYHYTRASEAAKNAAPTSCCPSAASAVVASNRKTSPCCARPPCPRSSSSWALSAP